mmetsp:Transcript_10590/g.14273  ORF Transcript_10590/g.14273 Transcript_10590/m.14273 type:complete len:210 (-) Transcript_10590:26-655(-)
MSNLWAALAAHDVATVLALVAVLVPFDIFFDWLACFSLRVSGATVFIRFFRLLIRLPLFRTLIFVARLFLIAIFKSASSPTSSSSRLNSFLFFGSRGLFGFLCRHGCCFGCSSTRGNLTSGRLLLLGRLLFALLSLRIFALLFHGLVILLSTLLNLLFLLSLLAFSLILVSVLVLRLRALVVLYNLPVGGPLASSSPVIDSCLRFGRAR